MTNREELQETIEGCYYKERELTWKRYQSSTLDTKIEILEDILAATGNAKCVMDELDGLNDKWMKTL